MIQVCRWSCGIRFGKKIGDRQDAEIEQEQSEAGREPLSNEALNLTHVAGSRQKSQARARTLAANNITFVHHRPSSNLIIAGFQLE